MASQLFFKRITTLNNRLLVVKCIKTCYVLHCSPELSGNYMSNQEFLNMDVEG